MNSGVIDRFTDVFTRYIDSGFGLLGGEVAFLASTLIVIDVTIAGLFWAWSAEEDLLAGGMDPDFREQLFAAGQALDAAGVSWTILSAFRDDYRQSLAVGFRESVGNSFHG